jgi:hypothetical protein
MSLQGDRLIAKIRALPAGAKLPANVRFIRTHAGHWQRSQGSWSWFLEDADTGAPLNIGSQYPQRYLTGGIAALDSGYDEWSIFPA